MSVLYRTQQQNLMYSEMELMMESSLVSGSHSNSRADDDDEDDHVEMMLERFICNYGSSSSIFMKEEKEDGSGSSDHHQDQDQQAVHDDHGGDHHHHHHVNNVNAINIRSNLIRQNSSPPQFFSLMTLDNNGFTSVRAGSRLGNENQINFSSGSPARISSRHMPQIAENGNDSNWDNSSFNGLKRARDHNDLKLFSNALEIQNDTDFGNRGGLTHHLSLPKNLGMPSGEKVLHFQGSVPCKMRAKRGFATHPRSIAERVRRTRISERMRRLEDLFPNIDKQTSIADKLELAVEYIKDLEKQLKTLSDTKAKCSCSSKQKQHSNPCA